jgi:hypothetical protein
MGRAGGCEGGPCRIFRPKCARALQWQDGLSSRYDVETFGGNGLLARLSRSLGQVRRFGADIAVGNPQDL